jgi:hypothetical protein
VPLFSENPRRLILGKPEVFAVQLGKIITRCGGKARTRGVFSLYVAWCPLYTIGGRW